VRRLACADVLALIYTQARKQGSEKLTYLQLLKLADERRADRLERFDKIGRIVVENQREACFRNL
jgi:hypothetical protein